MGHTEKRIDTERNESNVTEVFAKFFYETGHIPTHKFLMKETGLSKNTVTKYLKEICLDDFTSEFTPLLKQVLKKLFDTYEKEGKTTDGKLLLQVVGKFKEATETTITVQESDLADALKNRLGI